jgi:hypothetical protein
VLCDDIEPFIGSETLDGFALGVEAEAGLGLPAGRDANIGDGWSHFLKPPSDLASCM